MTDSRRHPAASRCPQFLAALVAACCCLPFAAAAASAAPAVTIGGFPASNDTKGTFSFGIVPFEPVLGFECSLDGGVFSECSSPLPLSGLSVTSHTFRVRATGLDLSVGEIATYSWTIDMTDPPAPNLILPANNLLTSDTTPTFSGTAEPLSRIPIFDGSHEIGRPQADPSGNWSFTPLVPLADGPHTWNTRAVDEAGNYGPYSATRSLQIDTVAPPLPTITTPAAAGKVNQRRPTFTGGGEPGSTVTVVEGVVTLCTALTNTSGTWSCSSEVDRLDGAHTVGATANDQAGNVSSLAVRSFTLDATPPPAPTLTQPLNGLATVAASLVISGHASSLAVVKIYDDASQVASVVAAIDGSWSFEIDPIDEGDYDFTAREFDDYDNFSVPSSTSSVRVDRTAPTVSFAVHPAARSNQANAVFGLSADEPNVDFECALDSGAWLPCSASPVFNGLAEGSHTLRIRGSDRAGNSAGQKTFVWSIDTTPPVVPTLNQPVSGASLTTSKPQFSGGAESGVTVEVQVDSLAIGSTVAATPGSAWSFVPATPIAQGLHQVRVRAIDAAGNASAATAQRNIQIDSIAPLTTITGSTSSPTTSQQASVIFSLDDPLATASCSLDGGAFVPCSSPYGSPLLAEGTHTIRVRGVDASGNIESPPKSLTIVVDRTAPIVQSYLISGSAGIDGVPSFQIASNDPTATGRCKLDNGAFVLCSGSYKPVGAAEGLHVLTVRFTDPAGNSTDHVIGFNVTPVNPYVPKPPPAPGNPYVPPPTPACDVLGAAGSTSGKASITSISGSKRSMTVKLKLGSAALTRVNVTSGKKLIASIPVAVKSGSTSTTVKLRRGLATGAAFEVAVRFYTVKREFGTVRIAGSTTGSGYKRLSGARSVLDTSCPTGEGSKVKPKIAFAGKAGARKLKLSLRSRVPVLVAVKLQRVGSTAVIAQSVVALGPTLPTATLPLLGSARLAAGSYRFSYVSIGAGGAESGGAGSFRLR